MRKTYVDNIRWMTVILVVIYHVIYMFNGVVTSGVIGPCVIRRETIRCHDEKLPPVVSAWLSSR